MSDTRDETHKKVNETHEVDGITFTMPEKSVDVRVSSHSASSPHASKDVFDVGKAFSDATVQKGTIVTDRKRARMSASKMLGGALSEWWQKTRNSVEHVVEKMESSPLLEHPEEPKVKAAETRTNVIVEAATYANQAPKDDHPLVVEKVRSIIEETAPVPKPSIAIKDPLGPVKPTWRTTEEEPKKEVTSRQHTPLPPTLNLSRGKQESAPPKPAPITAQVSQPLKSAPTVHRQTLDLRENATVLVQKPVIKPIARARETAPTWSHFSEPDKKTLDLRSSSTPVIEKTITKISTGPISTPALPKSVLPPEPPPPPKAPQAEPKPTHTFITKPQQPIVFPSPSPSQSAETLLDRIPRRVLLSVIALIGGVFGVMAAFSSVEEREDMSVSEQMTEQALIPGEIVRTGDAQTVSFGKNREELFANLRKAQEITSNESEVFSLVTEGGGAVSSSEFVSRLGSSVPDAFIRALRPEYAVGVVRGNTPTPFIVIRVPNYDTAFGGMLEWETTMSADLAPLFGNPVLETLAPGKGTTPRAQHFVDAIQSNRAIRILYDEVGNERIVYALVNGEYIVLTTSGEVLATVLSLLITK